MRSAFEDQAYHAYVTPTERPYSRDLTELKTIHSVRLDGTLLLYEED